MLYFSAQNIKKKQWFENSSTGSYIQQLVPTNDTVLPESTAWLSFTVPLLRSLNSWLQNPSEFIVLRELL